MVKSSIHTLLNKPTVHCIEKYWNIFNGAYMENDDDSEV